MSDPKRPVLEPDSLRWLVGTQPPRCPPPHDALLASRQKKRLGDALGLSDFGVNLVCLPPGGLSSLRHWHSHEDEFVYMLDGTVLLVTDAGEQELRAGMAAGFPKGVADGHHIRNASDRPATFLEVGSRHAGDTVEYSDIDMKTARPVIFTTKAGTPIT